jgi:uncharacterized protein YegP (UPF0339 family)
VNWYRRRIGEPNTDDEARGYWIFALGVVLGIGGILVFLTSEPGGGVRQWSIVLASVGLVMLLAGPIIRLPLRRSATWLVCLGVVVSAAAIVWFLVAFPSQWSPQTGQPTIIGLYAVGLLVMAVGGVFVPILTGGRDIEAELASRQAELDDARAGLADTEADEADLAEQLRALRTSQARFELYEDRGDEWRWRLRHRNGQLIADSGEGYTALHNAQNGLESVRRNALGATLLLIESAEELPAVDEVFEPVPEVESQAAFELYEDTGGEHRWRLVHENGNVIADSSEGYVDRRGAQAAIDGVKQYVGPADYLRPDPTAFEVYRDRASEYRWRLVHENGNIVADGGQGYSRRHDVVRTIDRIRSSLEDFEFETYEDRAGEFRWRLKAANNELVADSGEGYASRDGIEAAVERMREFAPEADVLDIGRAAFEVYGDESGEFRWRLRHRNGNILADSGEGYADRTGAWDGIASVKRNGPNAPVNA